MSKIIICLKCITHERVKYNSGDDSLHCEKCGNFAYAEKMEGKFKIGVKDDVRGMRVELETRNNTANNSISETIKHVFKQEEDMAKKECRKCKEVKSLISDGLCGPCYKEEFGHPYKPKKHYVKKGDVLTPEQRKSFQPESKDNHISIPINIDYDKLAEKVAPIVTNLILKRITTKQIIFEIK